MSWLSRVRLDGVYKIIAEINFVKFKLAWR